MKILALPHQLIVAAVGAILVLFLGVLVQDSTVDQPLTAWFNSFNTGAVLAVTDVIYLGLQPIFSSVFALVGILIYLALRRPIGPLLAFCATVIVAWLPLIGLKRVYDRPRLDRDALLYPINYVPHDSAYPSGHTAFVCGIAVAVLIATYSSAYKNLARILAIVAIVIIVCVVMTVGVHYVTDALGSILWATTVGPLGWLLVEKYVSPQAQVARLPRAELDEDLLEA